MRGPKTTTLIAAALLIAECCVLIAISAPAVTAQNPAESRAASLRTQLVHVQEQQAELQTRLRQLDEDLKPENIEKGLAGVGSTHPEDLREQRRRQLEIERKGLQAQLDLLATSRTRLETGVAQAEGDAYHQRASPNAGVQQPVTRGRTSQSSGVESESANSPTIRRRTRRTNRKRKPRRVSQGKLLSAGCADYTD